MSEHLAPSALLPDGWARDVLLVVDERGALADVRPEAPPNAGEPLPGPVVPGMINLHSHAFQRAMAATTERGASGPDTFWSWRERMYAFLEVLGPEEFEVVARQLYTEMLEAGYTSVVEFHYVHSGPEGRPYTPPHLLSRLHVEAARTAGIGLTHLPTLYRTGGFGSAPLTGAQHRFVLSTESLLRVAEATRREAGDTEEVRVGLGLHSLRAVPPRLLMEALNGFDAIDATAPVHIHVAEQLREVEACVEWSGTRPVAWLLEHAPVGPRWCLVHATHMDDAEVEGLARSGAVAGLCPTTEANLGDGIFRLRDYLDAGGVLGIGSDSHVAVDAAAELRLLEYGQRLVRRERNVVVAGEDASSGRRLWEKALEGGARASGRPVGRLEVGMRADWIVLDPEHPALAGRDGDQLLDALVFFEGARPIREVTVGGRRRVAGGRHVHAEEAADAYRRVAEVLPLNPPPPSGA